METEIYYKNELGAVSALFASDTDQNRHTEHTVLNIFFISHTNNFLMSIFFLSFMKKKENEFQDPMMYIIIGSINQHIDCSGGGPVHHQETSN